MTSETDKDFAIRDCLAELRGVFNEVATVVARACEDGGKLAPELLDQHQVPSLGLAWAAAELQAAEVGLSATEDNSNDLNAQLVNVFIAEAITSVRDRLEQIMLQFDVDDSKLQSVVGSGSAKSFRRNTLAPEAMCELAHKMADTPSEIGRLAGGKLALSDELTMIQDAFERFAKEVVEPQAEEIHRQDLCIPEELLDSMREMGVFGLSVPEQYGGSAPDEGDDNLTMVVVTEALSEASLGAAGSLITRPEILTRALLNGGTESQKKEWLPKIAAGDPLCAIAMTEPDFGSDVANLNLRGTKVDGGWLLNGPKTWCTFAGKAGVLMVVTRTDANKDLGYKGLSLLLVEKPAFDGHDFAYEQDDGGKLEGRAIPTIGYRGMHSFDLAFEDYFVPDENVIGGEDGLGKGFYYTMAGMMGGRMQTAARASGVMRAGLVAAITYAQDRKVFSAPLLSYPLTGARLTSMAARYVSSRMLAYTVAQQMDDGEGRMEASLVKLFACRSAELITRDSMQIHGGMGYAEEMPVSRYFVDARVLSIFEGAEETLALKVIAKSLLERALLRDAA